MFLDKNMKNVRLYLTAAIVATALLILWGMNIITPINNLALVILMVVIILGYTPLFGSVFLDFKYPKPNTNARSSE